MTLQGIGDPSTAAVAEFLGRLAAPNGGRFVDIDEQDVINNCPEYLVALQLVEMSANSTTDATTEATSSSGTEATSSTTTEATTPDPSTDICGYLKFLGAPSNPAIAQFAQQLQDSDQIGLVIDEIHAGCDGYGHPFDALIAAASASEARSSSSEASEAAKSSKAAEAQASKDAAAARADYLRQSTVTYAVTGDGSQASVTYSEENFAIEQDTEAALPWSKTLTIAASDTRILSMNAQDMDGSTITCTISVGGKVVDTHTSKGQYAIATCDYAR